MNRLTNKSPQAPPYTASSQGFTKEICMWLIEWENKLDRHEFSNSMFIKQHLRLTGMV
jgi:hypothetical protein